MIGMKEKWIWFDMDGTIADFYGVDGWLDDLMNLNTRPYELAKPLYDTIDLVNMLLELKMVGYQIGIISWLSKNRNVEFETRIAQAKKKWLAENLLDDILDKIIITPYGMTKADTCRKFGKGILIDDEQQNRDKWDLGSTIDANLNILEELAKLL